MRSLAIPVLLTLVLVPGFSLVAQDAYDSEVVHPFKLVSVSNLSLITAPDSSTPAIAKAALEIALSTSGAKCDLSRVDTITDSSLRSLTSKLSGIFCPTNGKTLRLAASFVPNGAIQGDSVIVSLIAGQPLLLEWKGALYVLYGVVYDEHLRSSGRRMNPIRQLLLIDPRYPDKRRFVAFERDRDDFAEVAGIATVSMIRQ